MKVSMLKGKIHRATVVQAELNYVGSITVDEDLLDAAGIYEYEKVHIVDIDNAQKHNITPLEFEVCEIDKYYIIIKLQNTLLASDLLNAT